MECSRLLNIFEVLKSLIRILECLSNIYRTHQFSRNFFMLPIKVFTFDEAYLKNAVRIPQQNILLKKF